MTAFTVCRTLHTLPADAELFPVFLKKELGQSKPVMAACATHFSWPDTGFARRITQLADEVGDIFVLIRLAFFLQTVAPDYCVLRVVAKITGLWTGRLVRFHLFWANAHTVDLIGYYQKVLIGLTLDTA